MIRVVTTCNAKGFAEYGFEMLRGFIDMWPQSVELLFYAEDFEYQIAPANVQIRALPKWFDDWKASHRGRADAHGLDRAKNRGRREYDYRRDCVKFAHKVAALTDAAGEACELLIWIDADTLTHAAVTEDWLRSLFPGDGYMAWLDRQRVYPECGFMMFRPGKAHGDFMRRLRATYESNKVFKMTETHDSFVIQKLVQRCVDEQRFPEPYSLSGKARMHHHVFPHSRLGERLDHAKGALKEIGRTPKDRLATARGEAHWS